MSLCKQTFVIAPPVTPSPAKALSKKFGIALQCGSKHAFIIILDPSLPALGDQPSGNEVVVVRIKIILAPTLVAKAVQKFSGVKDFSTECTCSPGHAGGAAVHVMRGRNLEVAPFKIIRSEPVVTPSKNRATRQPLDLLAYADSANLRDLQSSQQPWQDSRRPRHVVIHKYCY